MSKSALREAVRGLIVADPDIHPSIAGHAHYIERYRTSRGANIGLETRGVRQQNLFVEAHQIDLSRVGDIPHHVYPSADFDQTKPNHNLFHVDAFGAADVVRFKLSEPGQAERVLAELKR